VEKMASQVNLLTAGSLTFTVGPFDRHLGKPLYRINEKILERGHIGLFAAYADFGASFAFGCLLALKTKHGVSSLGVVFYIIVLVLVDLFFTAEQSF
jgi:hypothetical protein